ncbi:hypothetical protein NOR_08427 [Metarhizium rileyi]|uniref:Uncharacterized protein n=1 Tax=Metarhizium rileyi (strain RCEF 4871) TaxID=1649241 RepID=A0A166W9F8_METRR|nr:hypothetical protein NOR_08427 [Metarhizium rileyi RCEF 4871]
MCDNPSPGNGHADIHDAGSIIDKLARVLSDNHVIFARNLSMVISNEADDGTANPVLEFKAELISAQAPVPAPPMPPSVCTPLNIADPFLTTLDWTECLSEPWPGPEQVEAGQDVVSGGVTPDHLPVDLYEQVMNGRVPSGTSPVLHLLQSTDEQTAQDAFMEPMAEAGSLCVFSPAGLGSPNKPRQPGTQESFIVSNGCSPSPGPSPPSLVRRAAGSQDSPSRASAASEANPERPIASRRLRVHLASTARSVLRPDWAAHLEAELPRWARGDLWKHAGGAQDGISANLDSSYRELQLAYSAVCLLHTRMGDDAIRGRIALVELYRQYLRVLDTWELLDRGNRSIGRGDSTYIIDHILENAHPAWPELGGEARSALRSQFHDRKRYGKRWSMLADGLGEGIFFMCSPKLDKLV